MRKPRDFDAELKALEDKARGLKARKVQQLGELVIATGADSLTADELAGALIVLAGVLIGEYLAPWSENLAQANRAMAQGGGEAEHQAERDEQRPQRRGQVRERRQAEHRAVRRPPAGLGHEAQVLQVALAPAAVALQLVASVRAMNLPGITLPTDAEVSTAWDQAANFHGSQSLGAT